MAIQDKQAFIKNLTDQHRRQRPLMLSWLRALLWFAVAVLVSAVWMYSVQPFRSGFAGQLVHHPLFLLEIGSAFLLSAWGAYVLMVRSTPGERMPRGAVATLWILAVLFVAGFASSFTHLAPEATMVGKRGECWHEVVTYGAVVLLILVAMVRRGWVRFSWRLGMLYGLVAGFIPAALMQLACMYVPSHAFKFHYLPILILVPVGILAMRAVRK